MRVAIDTVTPRAIRRPHIAPMTCPPVKPLGEAGNGILVAGAAVYGSVLIVMGDILVIGG